MSGEWNSFLDKHSSDRSSVHGLEARLKFEIAVVNELLFETCSSEHGSALAEFDGKVGAALISPGGDATAANRSLNRQSTTTGLPFSVAPPV